MNNMKMKIYGFLAFLIILASCDVLDKEPLDIIADGVVWNDPVLMDSYLTEQYANTTVFVNDATSFDDAITNTNYVGMFNINELSDECTYHWGFYNRVKIAAMKGGLMTAQANFELMDYWDLPYKIIRALNIFLERIEEAPVDADFKAQKSSEARFLRAFNYFAMVKRYGGVPLITNSQNLNDSEEILYPRRNSEKEVYDFIISEMDDIVQILPSVSSDLGRVSKYAALALKSRAALYAASIAKNGEQQLDDNGKYILGFPAATADSYYQKSYEASKIIVSEGYHSLYNQDADKTENFKNIFLNEGNAEVIFAKRFDGNNAGVGWGYDFSQCPIPHAWGAGHKDSPFLEMAEEFERLDGTPGKIDRDELSSKIWTTETLWGGRDPRFYATFYVHGTPWQGSFVDLHNGIEKEDGTIITDGSYSGADGNGPTVLGQAQMARGSNGAGTSFGVLKYLDESANNLREGAYSKTDYIVFRYAEVLLNLAEAAYELGKEGEAKDAINEIRERAGLPKRGTIDMNDIIHERKVELAFEGHRYWDLRRWRIAEEKLTGGQAGIRYIYVYDANSPGSDAMPAGVKGLRIEWWANTEEKFAGTNLNKVPLFRPHYYYLPISAKRIGQNSNLIENPGY